VRTRLRRGLERLRARLRARFEDPAAFVLALLRLEPHVPPAALPVSTPVTPGPLLAALAMKKTLLAASFVLAAALVTWFAVDRGREPASARPADRAPVAAAAPASLAPVDAGPEPEPAELAAREAVEPARPLPAAASAEEASTPDAPSAAAPSQTATLRLLVEDTYGNPVPGAVATTRGVRPKDHPGDYWSITEGQVATGETDLAGIVELAYPRWLGTYQDREEVAKVMFVVEHPDYVTFEEQQGVPVDEAETVVTLERGSFLIVSGWIDSPDQRLLDVVPHLSDGAGVADADWLPIRDGRPSCNKIPPGRHAVYLTFERTDGTWASDVVEFELEEAEREELHLQLFSPRSLLGTLDEAVPRPVVDGEVCLGLNRGTGWGTPSMLRLYRAPVDADGSFELAGLPPGTGEMVGLCRGWVSRTALVPAEDEDDDPDRILQPVPAGATDFVLAMEPTATVEVRVLDPDGEPLPGAAVWMWPNVRWSNGYSSILLDRQFVAVSGPDGTARVVDLPAGTNEGLQVVLDGYRMPERTSRWDQTRRQEWVDLVSGERTRLEVVMEAVLEEDGD